METQNIFAEEKWAHILSVLPRDLNEPVRATGCVERFRNVRSGADPLRVMLAYGVSDLSLKETAAWAKAGGIKFAADVMGVLNGFDRLVFRGTLRHIVYPEGMMAAHGKRGRCAFPYKTGGLAPMRDNFLPRKQEIELH